VLELLDLDKGVFADRHHEVRLPLFNSGSREKVRTVSDRSNLSLVVR